MRFVVDASIVIKWVVEEGDSTEALALRRQHRLIAPDLLTAEFGNVLRTKLRAGDLDVERAEIAARSLLVAGIDLRPMSDLLLPALRLATRLRHPAYDCFYLALALAETCPLVTADERFLQAVASYGDVEHRAACVSLDYAVNWKPKGV